MFLTKTLLQVALFALSTLHPSLAAVSQSPDGQPVYTPATIALTNTTTSFLTATTSIATKSSPNTTTLTPSAFIFTSHFSNSTLSTTTSTSSFSTTASPSVVLATQTASASAAPQVTVTSIVPPLPPPTFATGMQSLVTVVDATATGPAPGVQTAAAGKAFVGNKAVLGVVGVVAWMVVWA